MEVGKTALLITESTLVLALGAACGSEDAPRPDLTTPVRYAGLCQVDQAQAWRPLPSIFDARAIAEMAGRLDVDPSRLQTGTYGPVTCDRQVEVGQIATGLLVGVEGKGNCIVITRADDNPDFSSKVNTACPGPVPSLYPN